MTYRTTFAAALTALALGFAAPLAAQDATTVIPADIAASEVTDAQVKDFVSVLLKIEKIRAEYTPKLQAEADDEKRQALADQANVAAVEAISSAENLTAEEYLGIGKAASTDQALTARISERMAEIRAQ